MVGRRRHDQHERALLADERRAATDASARVDANGLVDVRLLAQQQRVPYSPLHTLSTPSAASAEVVAARERVDRLVAGARDLTRARAYEARVRRRVAP
jgi:hypothetical protein